MRCSKFVWVGKPAGLVQTGREKALAQLLTVNVGGWTTGAPMVALEQAVNMVAWVGGGPASSGRQAL